MKSMKFSKINKIIPPEKLVHAHIYIYTLMEEENNFLLREMEKLIF